MERKSDFKSIIISAGTVLYFLALIIVNQFGGVAVSIVWSVAISLLAFMGLYSLDFRLNVRQVLFIVTVIFTGILNEIMVGTTTHSNQFLLVLYVLASFALISPYVSEKYVLLIVYLNALVIVYKFITVGYTGMIYTTSSSNFVSVQLLYPIVLYYCICEKKELRISMVPAVIVWVLSLLSRGRGGIISTTILLIGLIIASFDKTKGNKRIVFLILGIGLVGVAFLNVDKIISVFNSSIISEYFRARGLESSRIWIWKDYISTITDFRSFLFGGDLSRTYAGIYLEGNIHNSFLNIHLQNGLIMLIIIVIFIIRDICFGIKNKKWVYTICLFAMLIRAFTDNVFWPAYGTPILFFLLFYIERGAVKRKIRLLW